MPEIKTKLIELSENEIYTSKGEEYVITEKHSLADILRFLIDQADNDKGEIKYLLENIEEEEYER